MTQILFKQRGTAGIVVLNRPEALNALSTQMLEALAAKLIDWQSDARVKLIIITSSSTKAFCAGGDVRQAVAKIKAAADGRGDTPEGGARHYFQVEYGIDAQIASYPKPVIALVDGIIMGGGLGLAENASHMVISQTIRLAMPETAIGLFPDVGASLFLRRAGLPTALMLGMTGTIIGVGDALAWRLADRIVPAGRFDALITALSDVGEIDDVDTILAEFSIAESKPELALEAELIATCFTGEISDILANLSGNSHPLAAKWHHALQTRCPASIAAIHHIFHKRPAPTSIYEALNLDFKLALNMTARADFVEGVRAALIEKDNQPKWSPASLASIPQVFLEELFDFDGLPDLQADAVST